MAKSFRKVSTALRIRTISGQNERPVSMEQIIGGNRRSRAGGQLHRLDSISRDGVTTI